MKEEITAEKIKREIIKNLKRAESRKIEFCKYEKYNIRQRIISFGLRNKHRITNFPILYKIAKKIYPKLLMSNYNLNAYKKKEPSIDVLLQLEGKQFIEGLYRNILSREPDAEGYNYYMYMLMQGVPKEVIAYYIAKSIEARQQNINIKSVNKFKNMVILYELKCALQRIPVLSSSFTGLYRLIKLPLRFNQLSIQFKKVVRDVEHIKTQIGSIESTLAEDDEFYVSLENKFRGTRWDIQNRQSQYLVYILKAADLNPDKCIFDLGCGRGEFLELLKERGIKAKGVDLNGENMQMCSNLGLDVQKRDILEYIKEIGDKSLAGIVSFQVVEHLPIKYLVDLLTLSFKKIASGGLILLETVNPHSLFSLMNFWIDPTHIKPIPLHTLKFLVEYVGFNNVEVVFYSPVPDEVKLKGDDENINKLNNLLFGPQGYAIVGWKS